MRLLPAITLSILALSACEESSETRSTAADQPAKAEKFEPQAGKPSSGKDMDPMSGSRTSTLGKARDAVDRTVDKMKQRDAAIQKQIEDGTIPGTP